MNTAEKLVSGTNESIQFTPGSRAEFEVIVIFTRTRPTLRALKAAGRLAHGLGVRIRLIVPRIVPYAAHLKDHLTGNVLRQFRLRTIVGNSRVDTRVDVRLCRDRWELLQQVLVPESIVVLGAGRPWWSTAEARLARDLRAAGHHVMISREGRSFKNAGTMLLGRGRLQR